MQRLAPFLVGLALALAAASGISTARGAGAPPELGAWKPWMRLGGDGPQLSEACGRIEGLISTSRLLLSKRTPDAETRALLDGVFKDLGSMDADGLYERLGETGELSPTRTLRFSGRVADERYLVTLGKNVPARSRLGDTDARMSLAPAVREDRFILDARAESHTGGIEAAHILGFYEGALDWLEEAVRHERPVRATGLGPADASVLARLSAAFPNTTSVFLELIEINDVIAPSSSGGRARFRGRLRVESIKARYPRLAESMASMRGLFRGRARVVDDRGETVAILKFDSEDFGIGVDFDGSLRRVLSHPYHIIADLRSKPLGLTVELRGVRIDSVVTENEREVRFTSSFRRAPSVRIEGAALGLVPVGAIDALIPSTLEGMARAFLRNLAHGNRGRGVESFVALPVGHSTLSSGNTMELTSNGFMRVAANIALNYRADRGIEAERSELAERWVSAFEADLRRFRRLQGI